MQQTSSRWHKAWILPPIIIGIAVLIFMKGSKQSPARVDQQEVARVVRIVEVPQLDLIPQAEGYGIVQPAQKWTAVAQVTGRVIETHERLRNGEIIQLGETLFRIDPVDYELAIASIEAELAELDVQEKNSQASLEIEKRTNKISQRELTRLRKLGQKGTTSQSSIDEAERATLNSQSAVQNLENSIALIPSKRKVLAARLAQAQRDLANTTVKAPFNLRIANNNIEIEQFVSKGQTLFEGDSVDRVEIITQVPISSLRNLFIGREKSFHDIAELNQNLAQFTGFKPLVRLDMGSHTAEWQAEFVRFTDSVDPQTRTIGIVVAVDKPLDKVRPGYRPPLSKDMFVQVILRGHPQANRIIVPRIALHDDNVYLLDAEQRLRIKPVKLLYHQDSVSVIQNGLQAGDKLVVSDVVPAIDGMLLAPQTDDGLQQKLLHSAAQ
ncbi:MAG: efflux RND transporter periplasmic adaptor subunit [Chromatiales bacterium]|jgi:RND family efflux transporter MFP subunit